MGNYNYSWLVDEMERLGHRPKLAHPLEAKRRMGLTKKTDKLDATGLAILLRNGTLPEVWIPPSELRDQRELLRLRLFLVVLRTARRSTVAHAGFLLRAPPAADTPPARRVTTWVSAGGNCEQNAANDPGAVRDHIPEFNGAARRRVLAVFEEQPA